jgi:4'-phosphopantetheinyl transferase EntD
MLEEALPPGVRGHFAASAPEGFVLTAAEQQGCGRFSGKRLSDFAAGRYCASEALRILGQDRVSVPIGESRQPVWPVTIVGSIAHTSGMAAAIVANERLYAGLGLDLERLQSMDNIAAQICTERELALPRSNAEGANHLSVIFSAKEAVYKCVWPLTRTFFSFHDIELAIDHSRGRFRVVWHNDIDPVANSVHGFWRIAGDLIGAVAVLMHDADT